MKRSFLIHDNFRRPFKVEIEGDLVKVFKNTYSNELGEKEIFSNRPTLEFEVEKVFVGKDPNRAELLKMYNQSFDGNSILLKLKNNEYIYIGDKIFKFKPEAEITKYLSPVGNSDVPYPYAKDKEGNYYLMIEDAIISGVPRGEEPYDIYYGFSSNPVEIKVKKLRRRILRKRM